MVRRVFVDTKWSPRKNRDSKMHVCYDPEKDGLMKMFRLEDFTWKYQSNRYLDPYKKKEIFNFIIE